MSVQPLFTPVRMGDLDLPNRIVMAVTTILPACSPVSMKRWGVSDLVE